MSLSLAVGPATEPVTLVELKAQMKLDHTADDTRLAEMVIPTARQLAEAHTGRAFITQTWVLTLRGFGMEPIVIPKPPLVSITSVHLRRRARRDANVDRRDDGVSARPPDGPVRTLRHPPTGLRGALATDA